MKSQCRYPTTEEINELARLHQKAADLMHQATLATQEAEALDKAIKARMPLPLLDREGR